MVWAVFLICATLCCISVERVYFPPAFFLRGSGSVGLPLHRGVSGEPVEGLKRVNCHLHQDLGLFKSEK